MPSMARRQFTFHNSERFLRVISTLALQNDFADVDDRRHFKFAMMLRGKK
jgi:hypothetical protein